MPNRQRPSKARRGVVTVEYALALPLVLLFFFAMIEFSRAAMLKFAANNAAYEAARVGIVPGVWNREVQDRAEEILRSSGVSEFQVSISPRSIIDTTPDVEVQVTVPYQGNSWVTPRWLAGGRFVSTIRLVREDF